MEIKLDMHMKCLAKCRATVKCSLTLMILGERGAFCVCLICSSPIDRLFYSSMLLGEWVCQNQVGVDEQE